MRQECRDRFPHHRLQRKPLLSNLGMHHGTCATLTVVRPTLIPYRFLIRAVKARALKKRSCRTILSNARSCRGVVFRGAPEDLPGTKDPVAACLVSMRLTVAPVKPTRAAIAPCLMPSRASANTSCLIPIGVGRGIVRTIRKTFEKICKYWFKVVTVWRLIWGNDHLYCGFGARRSHLTLHWMSAQGSVGFRWGTITGPYHANFSQVETQKFDPHWFYCLQWGCNNLFCQECTLFICNKTFVYLSLRHLCIVKSLQIYVTIDDVIWMRRDIAVIDSTQRN